MWIVDNSCFIQKSKNYYRLVSLDKIIKKFYEKGVLYKDHRSNMWQDVSSIFMDLWKYKNILIVSCAS